MSANAANYQTSASKLRLPLQIAKGLWASDSINGSDEAFLPQGHGHRQWKLGPGPWAVRSSVLSQIVTLSRWGRPGISAPEVLKVCVGPGRWVGRCLHGPLTGKWLPEVWQMGPATLLCVPAPASRRWSSTDPELSGRRRVWGPEPHLCPALPLGRARGSRPLPPCPRFCCGAFGTGLWLL